MGSIVFLMQWLGLALGAGLWGWWLAALAAPKAIALGAALLLIYGVGVGWGSLVPASGAVSMVIATLIARDIFPAFWPDRIPYKYWAYTVLLLWGLGLGVMGLATAAGHTCRGYRGRYRWGGRSLLGLTLVLALEAGARLYAHRWPGWLPWP
jgi:hypothetical protein